jgi:hypothetical protein
MKVLNGGNLAPRLLAWSCCSVICMRENKLKNAKWGFYCICNPNMGQLATLCDKLMVALEK